MVKAAILNVIRHQQSTKSLISGIAFTLGAPLPPNSFLLHLPELKTFSKSVNQINYFIFYFNFFHLLSFSDRKG